MIERNNFKIIGLGGVGTALCSPLCKFLEYDRCYDSHITLIDGDSYEEKNKSRQFFSMMGNKASIIERDMRHLFSRLSFDSISEYINADNVSICVEDSDIIFLCVDNHKTRKIISDYVSTLNNIMLISGGNEFTDGNIQIHIRKEGKDITPRITDYHPEILNAEDKSPDEMSCEELSKSEPQLLFTNLTVATLMCWVFYNASTGENVKSEIYFDIKATAMNAVNRKPKM